MAGSDQEALVYLGITKTNGSKKIVVPVQRTALRKCMTEEAVVKHGLAGPGPYNHYFPTALPSRAVEELANMVQLHWERGVCDRQPSLSKDEFYGLWQAAHNLDIRFMLDRMKGWLEQLLSGMEVIQVVQMVVAAHSTKLEPAILGTASVIHRLMPNWELSTKEFRIWFSHLRYVDFFAIMNYADAFARHPNRARYSDSDFEKEVGHLEPLEQQALREGWQRRHIGS